MTEFHFVVNAAPALRILCGHELFAALEPLKFAVSVRIHWRCAVFKAGIESILNSGVENMVANSRAVGTTTTGPLAVVVPSRIQIRCPNNLLCSKRTSNS